MLLPTTIPDGQAVIRWNRDGTGDLIEGPTRIWAPFARIEPTHRHLATETEYLRVTFQDGHCQHFPGPAMVWFDPLLHREIATCPALRLDTHQAVVIYRDTEEGTTHKVLRGPALHVPDPTETLHRFSWHGDNGKGEKVPHRLQFTRLRVIPDQMYFDVDNVRTADEALVTIKTMVFFELADIEQMLRETHDPIADFINALSADVVKFVGQCDFEQFKANAPALNELVTYQALCEGAARIGYHINKVVYRGYTAGPKLQAMHDNAIETRTRLVLETETEQQQQELIDLKQAREHDRAERTRTEENRTLTHRLETRRQKHAQEQAFEADRQAQEQANREALQDLEKQRLTHLQEAGADLTAILVAQEHNPDKLIRLEAKEPTPIHLHELA